MAPSACPRPDLELFTEIAIIDQLARNRVESRLPAGLSYAGLALLNHFARVGRPENPARLAEAFKVTKGAMTNTLQRLEALGFVAVARDPSDGRRKVVTLTARGVQAQREAQGAVRPQLETLRQAFPQADFDAALPFLRRLRAWLDQHR